MSKFEDLGIPIKTDVEGLVATYIDQGTIADHDDRRSARRAALGMFLVGGLMTAASVFPQGVETANDAIDRIPGVATVTNYFERGLDEGLELILPAIYTDDPSQDPSNIQPQPMFSPLA